MQCIESVFIYGILIQYHSQFLIRLQFCFSKSVREPLCVCPCGCCSHRRWLPCITVIMPAICHLGERLRRLCGHMQPHGVKGCTSCQHEMGKNKRFYVAVVHASHLSLWLLSHTWCVGAMNKFASQCHLLGALRTPFFAIVGTTRTVSPRESCGPCQW